MIDRIVVDSLNTTLNSERVSLIPINSYHANLLFSSMQDPSIYTWISSTPPVSVAELEERWSSAVARLLDNQENLYLNWAVQRKCDGAWIGKVDADINSDNIATNIGYLFFPLFWRQGYAIESVRLLVKHFSSTGILEQRAVVTDGNTASRRLLERVGFVKVRTLKGNDTIHGVLVDGIEYIYHNLIEEF
jgi:[ribosomal protein S5]-alanine N-acetyltransferase